jgi:hypothetical protein
MKRASPRIDGFPRIQVDLWANLLAASGWRWLFSWTNVSCDCTRAHGYVPRESIYIQAFGARSAFAICVSTSSLPLPKTIKHNLSVPRYSALNHHSFRLCLHTKASLISFAHNHSSLAPNEQETLLLHFPEKLTRISHRNPKPQRLFTHQIPYSIIP